MARKASKKTSTSASTSNPDSDSDNDNAEGAPSYTGVASLPSSTTAHTLPTKKSLLLSSLPSAAEEEQEENEEPLLFDPAFPDTRTALEKASVWIYVLDARDPEAWRSAFVEGLAREGEGKEVVFVLNKIGSCSASASLKGASVSSKGVSLMRMFCGIRYGTERIYDGMASPPPPHPPNVSLPRCIRPPPSTRRPHHRRNKNESLPRSSGRCTGERSSSGISEHAPGWVAEYGE